MKMASWGSTSSECSLAGLENPHQSENFDTKRS
jgi:hypothetical protein